ncbi:unnamed protein product [Closterium sp. NIES-54]
MGLLLGGRGPVVLTGHADASWRTHARLGAEIGVADVQPSSSISGDVANHHWPFDSQSPEPDLSARSGGKGAASTTGAGRDSAESIAEWRRRSAEAGAHFFPLQRAEDAPSRDELHRRILGGVGGGLKGKGKSQRAAKATEYLPVLQYDSTLLSTANGTLGNTMVNYSTYLDDTIRLPYAPRRPTRCIPLAACHSLHFYAAAHLVLVLTSMRATLPHASASCFPLLPPRPFSSPRTVLHISPSPPACTRTTWRSSWGRRSRSSAWRSTCSCATSSCPATACTAAPRARGRPTASPSARSPPQPYNSCADQRCQGGVESGYYGCNTEGFPNYLNTTGMLPGDDALCVYDVYAEAYDYYEADTVADSFLESAGHVVEDTVYLTAPDGTEAHRSIIFGCGVNQLGYWGMQGRSSGAWTAGGVLGLAQGSPFLEQLTAVTNSFAVCLDKPTPTSKTTWDGKMQQHTGSSHLTIGAAGLPAGASYSTLSYPTGLPYSHITLTTATRVLNITDDPANINLNKTSYMPADASEDDIPGFFFLPESFVHLIRLPLFISLWSAKQEQGGGSDQGLPVPLSRRQQRHLPLLSLASRVPRPGFGFSILRSILEPSQTGDQMVHHTSPYSLSPCNTVAMLHCFSHAAFSFRHPSLSPFPLASTVGASCMWWWHGAEPGLFNKYLFFNYTNNTVGWLQAPQCGAEPILPPPPPSPPPSGGTPSKGATHSLSLLAAAVVVITTSTALLALALL